MLRGKTFGSGTGKNTGNRRNRARLIGAAVMAALGTGGVLTQQARAGNDLWVGGTNGNFATLNNWNPTSGPVSGDSLTFNAVGSSGLNLTDNLLTAGSYQIAGITFSSSAAAFVINPGQTAVNGFVLTGPFTDNATNTETFNDPITLGATSTFTVASGGTLNLGGAISGGFGITTSGAGTLNLSGTNSYTGATTVSQGSLAVSGTIYSPASSLIVGNVISQAATMQINSGANITGFNLSLGTANASSGVFSQSGGFVSLVQGGSTANLAIGAAGGGYGYYKMTGGTLLTNEIDVGGATGSNTGVMNVTGGTVNDTGWITIQRGTGGAGVLNVNGATIYAGTLNTGSLAMLWGGGSAQLSIANGSIIGPNNASGATGYFLNLSEAGISGTSVVNLNSGGLLQVSGVVANSTLATDLLNFNGGTLKFGGQNAGANGSFLLAAANLSAFIYGGGATIDSNGGAIAITKQLQAPTGDGVSAVPLTGLTTTGYVGAPAVTITGGTGIGATGVAVINSSGVLTGITITNPGTAYLGTDTLTVTLSGGGVPSSNETIAPTFVANVNTGGLTLNGNGQITIGSTGTDQYTGNTTVNGGKLTLDFNQSTITSNIINSASPLVLNGGNLQINGKASGIDSQTFNGTSLTDGGAIITMTPGTSGTILLNLGAITRTAPATLSITQPTVGTVSATNGVVTSTSNNGAGILGGWATVNAAANAADWATNNGTNIVALPVASYNAAFPTTGGSTTTNYLTSYATGATTTLTGPVTVNSLKITNASTGAYTLALGTNPLTFTGASGGLLLASGASTTITGSGAGILSAGTGNEFIIQDWSSVATTISAPIMGASDTGRLTKAGTGALTISSTNTYTGGTTIIGGTVTIGSNTALGTGPIEINPNGIVNVGNTTGIVLNSGIDIPNAITIDVSTFATGASGTITATGAAGGEIDGNITIKGAESPGGLFNAPTTAGVYLTLTGNLISTVAADNSSFLASGSTYTGIDAVVVRSGNIRIYNPGGLSSYYRFDIRAGVLQDGGPNGVATNASVDIGANAVASTFDLNGNNQTLVGISNTNNAAVARSVTNTNASSPSILTLTPLAAGQINSNLTSSGIVFTDSSASFPLSIVLNGASSGVQTFSSAVSTYHGSTTLTSGTLSIPALALGGVASSIGESTNAASNLVFGGGTLLYTGASTTTDRSFTVNANTTANMNVSSSAAVVTFSSAGTAAATTNGAFNKLGAGTLVFSGPQPYTGATTISAGTFQLTSTGSLAGSVVDPTGGTFVAAGTTTGATYVGALATIVPGASNFSNATLPTLPTVTLSSTGIYNTGPLTIQKNSVVDFAFNSSSNAQFNVTGALTLYGGALDFTTSGAATAFSTSGGPYTLFTYSGAFSGSITNFSITDAQSGKAYAFNNTGTQIQLTISNSSTGNWTNSTVDHLWTDSNNWLGNSIPNSVSATANFGSSLVPADGGVDLASTNETVGFLNLDNTSTPGNVSFTIGASGSGTLILDNGTAASPGITVVSGAHTISAPLRLNAPLAGSTLISTGAGSSLTLTGAISNGANGAQTATFAGPGTVILAEPNSTITTSNITGGILQIGNGGTAGTLGNSSVAISPGAALSFDLSSPTTSVTNNISGTSGSVNQFGSGIVTLSPSTGNTFGTTAGGLNISSGTIQAGNANGLPSGVLVTMSGGTLDLNTFSSSIALQNSSAGTITDNSGVAGTTTLTNTWTGALQTYSGNIVNGTNGRILAFNQSGSGVTALNGSNTYTGGTQITGGTLEALNNNALPPGTINMSGGAVSLRIGNGVTLPNKITLNGGAAGGGLGALSTATATDTATFSGEIDYNVALGSGGLIGGPTTSGLLSFTGPIIMSGPPAVHVRAGIVQLADTTGLSNYGVLQVSTGSLSIGHNNGIATNAVVQLSASAAGTLNLNGYDQTVAGIVQDPIGGAIITNTENAPNTNGSPDGANGTSILTVNTTATAFPDSAPDLYAGLVNLYVELVKTGPGTLSLTNPSATANSSYLGGTIIQQGVLAVAVLDGSGASNLGVSDVGASDLIFASPGGTLRYTGATSSTSRSFTINDGVTATMDVSTASAVLTNSGNLTVDGAESSSPASFNKGAGAGTLILTGTLPYHGNTGVAGGTLLVDGTTGTSGFGTINILAGGTLGGSGTVNGTLNHTAGTIVGGASATVPTTGTLTFTGPLTLNGGTDLNNILASSLSTSGVNQQGYITASGGLAFGASSETVSLLVTGNLSTGTYVYNLFDYTGTLSGTPNLSYISNLGRATFTTNLSTAGEVNVTIANTTAANLFWNSTTSGVWDVHSNLNASSGTANWYNAASNLATDKFFQGDGVTFADSGAAVGTGNLGTPLQTTISIASGLTVLPGAVTVSANSTNYTIAGPGAIGGTGSLTLSGTSTFTLQNSNTYSGPTNINGGILALANNNSLGALTTISFGGGTLQYSTSNTVDYSAQFSTAGNQAYSIDTNGQAVTFASNLVSSSGTLTKLGAGTLTLSGAGNSYSGSTTITLGTLSVSAQGNLGGNGPIVFSGGSLGGPGVTLSNALVVNAVGGSLVNTGNAFFTGSLTGSGTLVSSGSAADVFTGTGFTPGNNSSSASFTGTLVSQAQVNITDISASPYANYNASTSSGNSFIFGNSTYQPSGPVQLGSLTGVAGSTLRNGNTVGIGAVTFQIGALNSSTVFAGNIADGANGNTAALIKVGTGNLTLSGNDSYTGGTSVTAGTLTLASGGAYPANNVSGTALSVSTGALLSVANHGGNATYVPQISVLNNSGTIDITNNALLVHNGSASTVYAQIQQAYNNGLWNGTPGSGIITSSTAASDTTHLTAVGMATGFTSFEGIATVVATDVLVKYTYYGDTDLNGKVDGTDYSRIDNAYENNLTNPGSPLTGWYNGDFNYDGVVDGSDYTLMDNTFNMQGAQLSAQLASPTAQLSGSGSVVPEPATLGLLAIGALGLLGRRSRSNRPHH